MKIDAGMIKIIVVVVILLIVVITVVAIVNNIKRKLQRISNALFGTKSFVEGFQRQADRVAETPKSVSSMTRLMEPQIAEDFPGFSWNEFKHKAENMLTSALLAISAADISKLMNASDEVKKQVRNRIEANHLANATEHYENIRIHQTEISDYVKSNGKCIIKIQSAIEYIYYKEIGERLVAGQKDRKTQAKYNMELIYIQDADKAESKGVNTVFGVNCPNCGAPVKNLGELVCEYCGSSVTPINIKVWSLHKFYEVDYNNV